MYKVLLILLLLEESWSGSSQWVRVLRDRSINNCELNQVSTDEWAHSLKFGAQYYGLGNNKLQDTSKSHNFQEIIPSLWLIINSIRLSPPAQIDLLLSGLWVRKSTSFSSTMEAASQDNTQNNKITKFSRTKILWIYIAFMVSICLYILFIKSDQLYLIKQKISQMRL